MRKVIRTACECCSKKCKIIIELDNNNLITGNTCENGEAYARNVLENSQREVQGEIRVDGGIVDTVRFKLTGLVPATSLEAIGAVLEKTILTAPVEKGSILIENIADTGTDAVATCFVPQDTGH